MVASLGVDTLVLAEILFPFRFHKTPKMVALAHGLEALALGLWLLW